MAEQVGIEPSITWEHHYGTIQPAFTAFVPHLGHAIFLCSLPQFMQ